MTSTSRPAYDRALRLIEALEKENAGTIHGVVKAWLIATANDIDAAAERHRSNGTD